MGLWNDKSSIHIYQVSRKKYQCFINHRTKVLCLTYEQKFVCLMAMQNFLILYRHCKSKIAHVVAVLNLHGPIWSKSPKRKTYWNLRTCRLSFSNKGPHISVNFSCFKTSLLGIVFEGTKFRLLNKKGCKTLALGQKFICKNVLKPYHRSKAIPLKA